MAGVKWIMWKLHGAVRALWVAFMAIGRIQAESA